MSNQGALANLNVDEAIQQIANGKMLRQIAAEYGVVKSAVHKAVSKHPDYKEAVAIQAHTWVEDAMLDLQQATAETVNIARARADGAFKYARAHNPAYADKSQITVDVHHHLGDSLQRAESREREINPPIERIAQSDARIIDADTVRTPSVDL